MRELGLQEPLDSILALIITLLLNAINHANIVGPMVSRCWLDHARTKSQGAPPTVSPSLIYRNSSSLDYKDVYTLDPNQQTRKIEAVTVLSRHLVWVRGLQYTIHQNHVTSCLAFSTLSSQCRITLLKTLFIQFYCYPLSYISSIFYIKSVLSLMPGVHHYSSTPVISLLLAK